MKKSDTLWDQIIKYKMLDDFVDNSSDGNENIEKSDSENDDWETSIPEKPVKEEEPPKKVDPQPEKKKSINLLQKPILLTLTSNSTKFQMMNLQKDFVLQFVSLWATLILERLNF